MNRNKRRQPNSRSQKGSGMPRDAHSKEIGLIRPREITEEMKESYIDYAMSVIVSRALPDVRDGMKPVHRRILYAMGEMGLNHSAKYRKSATTVGEVLGKYHPHGDISVYDALTRMAQDFSMRYPLIDGQGNFGCFTKDTKIKLCDGRSISFEELILEQKEGKKHWTFAFNHENGKIEITEIKKPRLTRRNEKLMEVILDNGESIKCTLNHQFMTRDGNYKEANDLKEGDSLMPLYIKKYDGDDQNLREYEMVYQPRYENWEFTHRLADKWNLRSGIYKKTAGRIRHHLDFNKFNNNPDNILRIQWYDHWKYHKEIASSRHMNDIDYVKKISDGRKTFWNNLPNKEKYSQRMRERNLENWKNNEYREKMIKNLSEVNKKYIKEHPEVIKILSERASSTLKRLWKDPKYRALFHEKITASNKRRKTNLTGKKKFVKICEYLIDNNLSLDKKNFEKARKYAFGIKSFTSWDLGLEKYYNRDKELVLSEIKSKNHKVKKIHFLTKREDVYDLTTEPWHNFALAAGIFVHNSIDGDPPAAMRYCVTGDTLAVTENGLVPIKEISPAGNEDISKRILSMGRVINSASKWFDSDEHPIIKITTQNGFSIRGSYNHPILTWSKNINNGKPNYEWKLLSQIKLDDVAVIDRTPNILWPDKEVSLKLYWPDHENRRTEKKILADKLDENLAFILGCLISEGTVKTNEIEFCNGDPEFIRKFIEKWSKVFPDCRLHQFLHQPNSFGKKHYQTLEIHSRYVVEFLRNIGLEPVKSNEKKIPYLILQSPKPVMAAFLRACFEGDGSISYSGKMTELSYISTSDNLIKSLQVVLLRFGIASVKRYDKWRKNHKLYIRGLGNYKVFRNEIGFVCRSKREKLNKSIERLTRDYSQTDFVPFLSETVRSSLSGDYQARKFVLKNNFDRYPSMERNYGQVLSAVRPDLKIYLKETFEDLLSNNYLFDLIKKVEFCGKERVYSLRVDSDCHSFVANGFINHNTECRLSKFGEEILKDIEKQTVDFADNYDGTKKEPVVLPSPLPNLLLNGSLGIAVGMATNIPPHNLSELTDAISYLIDNPKATTEDLFKFIKGPDFPTGGQIFNQKEIIMAYSQGKGPILVRGKAEAIEQEKTGRNQIVISEIPFQIQKSALVEQFANLVSEKKIEGIKDIRDESDKEGMRIVIDLQKDAYPQKILNRLYKFSDLQKTFHLNLLALVEGLQPRVLNLPEVLNYFIEHRKIVVFRRTEYDLEKAKERAHILEGLAKAISNIDAVISTIKKSKDREEAKKNLMKRFKLTEIQAVAILEIKLQQLAKLERQKIEEELKQKRIEIKELTAIVKSPQKIKELIKKELKTVKENFGDERRTKVYLEKIGDIAEEDLIPREETIITLTQGGYIKRINPKNYKIQKRGGKGILGMKTLQDDIVEHFFTANTHDALLFFTDSGKVFKTPVYEIPEGNRVARGRGLLNFLEISPNEKVLSLFSLGKEDETLGIKYLVMVTQNGIIKKTSLSEFENLRKSGLIAITLKKGDLLKKAKKSTGNDQIILITEKGQAIRFREKEIREMGRPAAGVKGIRLKKGDTVVGMDVIKIQNSRLPNQNLKKEKTYLMVLTENGYGKRTDLQEYRSQGRGGSGIKAAKITSKTGNVVGAIILGGKEEDLIVISQKGQVIRTKISQVAKLSRTTQGVRVMKLEKEDKIASATCI